MRRVGRAGARSSGWSDKRTGHRPRFAQPKAKPTLNHGSHESCPHLSNSNSSSFTSHTLL